MPITWLDKAKGEVPDAAEFWYERRTLTRQLLALGDVKRAYAASAGFSEGPDGRVVDAQFHAGWIALAFLDDAKAAAPHFELMAEHSTLPDTITQANYWLGRALGEALGDSDGAKPPTRRRPQFGTVYYGQLARTALGMKPVELREMPEWQDERADLRGARAGAGRAAARREWPHRHAPCPCCAALPPQLTEGADMLQASQLAQMRWAAHHARHLDRRHGGTARRAARSARASPSDSLPTTKLAEMDHAAIFAISRQESRFQIDASLVGRRPRPDAADAGHGQGNCRQARPRLFQVPADHRRRVTTRCSARPISSAQLERFDGSLVLAAAAYNAGAGNANKWIRTFGDPRSTRSTRWCGSN